MVAHDSASQDAAARTVGLQGVEVVVLDVLGTLVDEPGGLRAAIREAAPGRDEPAVDELFAAWTRHRDREQGRVARGERAYASTDVIDREAAEEVADRAGLTDPAAVDRLATAARRLSPWPDTVAALERLAGRLPVLALSDASHATLMRLGAHAGLRWHLALSGEAVRAYKPAREVYRLALDAAGSRPDRVLMVAAHGWDLRAARACGLRTAWVRRPVGAAPTAGDDVDSRFDGLDELATALGAR
ncbi:haloacid dehalogenase type II [Isoptericola halotolerans]|uniref:haloacid dehalogenase type II n=1 Tax=Isoptericola halotolerans TaxID=300560 RepID=UPI00388DC5A8